jgi:rod shape-determining protein MreC
MDYGPPPLFNQGVSARARLAFFSCLAVALIIVDSRIRVLETVRVGVGVVLYPVQQALLVPSRVADAISGYFISVSELARESEAVQRRALENAQAVAQALELEAENLRLRQLLGARERTRSPSVLGAVLYEARDRFARRLVLHVGEKDGVRAGSPVIDEIGVVGQVTRVFPDTCEVTLLTDKDQSIPVQILRSGLRGVAFGGTDPGTLDLRFMASNADIVESDIAVTSGLDGIYPAGLPVGQVTQIERSAKDQFARIVLTPSAGIDRHRHLLVLLADPASRPPPPPADAVRKGGKR